MKAFVEHLKKALEAYIEPYLDEEIYFDADRLTYGEKYNKAIADDLCRSVCMIVVYVPKYKRRSYCLKEYRAMEKIEKDRMALMEEINKDRHTGDTLDERHGFIIPIILRGEDSDLPDAISKYIHYCDFRKFTTVDPDINKNETYVEQIEEIARYINKLYEYFEEAEHDPCSTCDEFDLPEGTPFEKMRQKVKQNHEGIPPEKTQQKFPYR